MSANQEYCRAGHGFTLLEVLIVISIMALVGVLVVSALGRAAPGRKVTEEMRDSIQNALEHYHSQFGEYPEPANPEETAELAPGKVYRIGAAKCLYQALRGDGYESIKGAGNGEDHPAQSDGKLDPGEATDAPFREMPPTMWRKVGHAYILVDAFGRPFQYVKAIGDHENTITAPYDLWSYGTDEENTLTTSRASADNPALAAKWIKNW